VFSFPTLVYLLPFDSVILSVISRVRVLTKQSTKERNRLNSYYESGDKVCLRENKGSLLNVTRTTTRVPDNTGYAVISVSNPLSVRNLNIHSQLCFLTSLYLR